MLKFQKNVFITFKDNFEELVENLKTFGAFPSFSNVNCNVSIKLDISAHLPL